MRRLILLRHSKAVAGAGAGDHARALSPRGLADAADAGAMLLERLKPDFALVSDARRTRETFDRVVGAADRDIPHRFERGLYGASPEEILALVGDVPANIFDLLIVGHNPGLGDLARRLAETGPPGMLADLGIRFPTSAVAILALSGDQWSDARRGGTLEAFVATAASRASN